jgi:hypothetical protein
MSSLTAKEICQTQSSSLQNVTSWCSSDSKCQGDKLPNPEQLLLPAVSTFHIILLLVPATPPFVSNGRVGAGGGGWGGG